MPGFDTAFDNSAVTHGVTSGPNVQPDPTLGDVWAAARQQTQAIGQTNSKSYYEQPFYDDMASKLNAAGYQYNQAATMVTGQQSVPFGQGLASPYPDSFSGYKGGYPDVEDQMWAARDAAVAAGKIKASDLPDRATYEKQIGQRMAGDNAQSSDILSRSHGIAATLTQFAGSAYQGLHDPAQAALIPLSEGVGEVLPALAGAGTSVAARVARFMAPQTTGAGLSTAASLTRTTLGSMAREGSTFAVGNAGMLPALHANDDAAGMAHDLGDDASQTGWAFLMGAGMGGVHATALPAAKALAGGASDVFARLYPSIPAPIRDFLAGGATRAGTVDARADLAGAAGSALRSSGVTPAEADALRTAPGAAIDAETSPFMPGSHGAETHGATLAAHRTALATDNPPPATQGAAFGAPGRPSGDYYGKLAQAESSNNPNAHAPAGTASGLFQFTDGTFLRSYRAAHGLGGTDAEVMAQKNDPAVQLNLVHQLTQRNATALATAGHPVTDANLYLAHFAGSTGAVHLLEADPAASAESVMGAKAVKNNPMLAHMTVGDVRDMAARKMGGSSAATSAAMPGAAGGDAAAAPDPVAARDAQLAGLDAQDTANDAQDAADNAQEAAQGSLQNSQTTPPPLPQIDPAIVGREAPDMPIISSPFDAPIYSREFSPHELTTDAATMQYKLGGDANGVTDRLKGDAPWVQSFAGKAVVFERADGQMVIADGHQRLGKAMQASAADPSAKIWLNADVLREADGWSPAMVRVAAALKNIAEGSGTSIDAARVLREAPEMAKYLPRNGPFMRHARGIAALDHETFGAVLNGVLSPEQGSAIGNHAGHAPETHVPLMHLLAGSGRHDEALSGGIVRQAMADGFGQSDHGNQMSMFGAAPAQALYRPMAQIIENAKKLLRDDKKIFGKLIEAAGKITDVGDNQLDHAANAAKVLTSEQAQVLIERTAQSAGPVRDALRAAAADLIEHKRGLGAASRDFLDRLGGIDLRDAAAGSGESAAAGGIHGEPGRGPDDAGSHEDLFGAGEQPGRGAEPGHDDGAAGPADAVVASFSDPHGAAAKAQDETLQHDFLGKPESGISDPQQKLSNPANAGFEPKTSDARTNNIDPNLAAREKQQTRLASEAPMRAKAEQDGTMGMGLFDAGDAPGLDLGSAPEAQPLDLKAFTGGDMFAVSGPSQTMQSVLQGIQDDAAAIAALKDCL